MRAIAYLALNFVRSQRIALAVMTVYLAGAGILFGWNQQREDVLFYLQWHSYNVIFIAAILAVPAIWSERQSRRILAVLSKGIHRWQYLGGIFLGSAIISAWLCLLIGASTTVLCHRGAISAPGLPLLLLVVFLACVTAQSVALFGSVFVHPLVAMTASAAFLLIPLAAQPAGLYLSAELFPVSSTVQILHDFHFQKIGTGLWMIAAGALLETLLFWILAAITFSRKDVTISAE